MEEGSRVTFVALHRKRIIRYARDVPQIIHEYLLCGLLAMPGVLFRLFLIYGFYEAGVTNLHGPFSHVQPPNILGCFIMGFLQSTKTTWFVKYVEILVHNYVH